MDIEYDILFTEVSPSVISSVTGRFAIKSDGEVMPLTRIIAPEHWIEQRW